MQKDISLRGLSTYRLVTLDSTETTLSELDCNESAHTLVVLNSEENTPELLKFLHKILSAVNIDPTDETIILALAPMDTPSLHDLSDCFELKNILFFGVAPYRVGLNYRLQKNILLHRHRQNFLVTDSLTDIMKNVAAKRALWGVLQALKK